MAETRQIGRVEEVDVMLHDRQPCLSLRLKLADGQEAKDWRPATPELLRDYLDVWGVDALQSTRSLLCWVASSDGALLELAPLMPDEGDTLDLRDGTAKPAAMPDEAPTAPVEAPQPVAKAAAPKWPGSREQWQMWQDLSKRARAAEVAITAPTAGATAEDIDGLLAVARAKVDAAEEQAQKERAAA